MNTHVPETTKRALVVAVLVGIAGLAVHEPIVIAAAFAGLFLGVGVVSLSGSPGRVMLAATLLPLGLVSVVLTVGAAFSGNALLIGGIELTADSQLYGGLLVLVATLLGLGLVGTVLGGVSKAAVSKASRTAFTGSLLGLLLGGAVYLLLSESDSDTVLGGIVSVTGEGLAEFAGTVVLAAGSLVILTYAVPKGALTAPDRREQFAVRRRQFVILVAVTTVGLVGILALAQYSGLTAVSAAVIDAPALRALLVAVTGLAVVLTTIGLIAGWSWQYAETDQNDQVPVLLGTILGLTVIIATLLLLGVPPGALTLVPIVLAIAGVGLLLLKWLQFEVDASTPGMLPVVLTALFVAGTIAVGGDIGDTATVGLSGLGAILSLGAGLFVYSVGTYGSTLSRELGTDAAGRVPQLVQIAYTVAVLTVASLIAVIGFWIAMAIAPTFSVPATIGVVSGLLAIVCVVWFLRRSA